MSKFDDEAKRMIGQLSKIRNTLENYTTQDEFEEVCDDIASIETRIRVIQKQEKDKEQ